MKKPLQLALIISTLAGPAHACTCHAAASPAVLGGGVGASAFFVPLQAAILTVPAWIDFQFWDWIGVPYKREYPNDK